MFEVTARGCSVVYFYPVRGVSVRNIDKPKIRPDFTVK